MVILLGSVGELLTLVDEDDGSEIGVRTALVLMVAFSTIAVLAGVESIVGAFLAGALTAFVLRGKEVLEEKLAVVGHGLFIPVFFVIVGLRFDVSAVTWASLAMAGGLFLVVFLVRLVPSLSLIRQGLGPRDVIGTACLLSAPLTLMVAIGALGVDVGAITGEQETTILVLAMGTGLVFPIFSGSWQSHGRVLEGRPGYPLLTQRYSVRNCYLHGGQ